MNNKSKVITPRSTCKESRGEISEEAALQRLARLCAGAEYCSFDLRRKMTNWQLPDDAQERILERLVSERFVDEERYAHAFVRDKFRYNRWGRKRIEQELRMRNIPDDIIDDALTEINDNDSVNTLEALLRSKLKTVKGKDDYDLFLKLLRYSVGRGFPQEQAHRCIRQILTEQNIYQ